MASTPQIVERNEGQGGPPLPGQQMVRQEVLRVTGLNAQAFGGLMDPSTIYRQMVDGSPSVFPFYREVEAKDTVVAGALEMRKLLVLARDASVVAADPDDPTAKMYAEALSEFHDSIRQWRRVLWELLDSRAYGYSVLEIVWEVGAASSAPTSNLQTPNSSIGIADVIGRPQELFRFGRLTEPQNGPLRLANFPGGEGQLVPETKFLVSTYRPRHGDRRGIPLLREVFWLSWLKRNGLIKDLQFLEKPAGTVVVQYPTGADDATRTLALDLARAVVDDSAAAAPESFKVLAELLASSRTRDGKDFSAFIEYCDQEITRRIQGQTLTTRGNEGGVGTQALGAVHEGTRDEMTRTDATDLEEVIGEQLDRHFLMWTFGPQALDRAVRPWWTIEKEPPKDRERELRIIEKGHKLLGADSKVPQSHVYEVAGLPRAEGNEPVLPQAAPGINELLSGVPPAEPQQDDPTAEDAEDAE